MLSKLEERVEHRPSRSAVPTQQEFCGRWRQGRSRRALRRGSGGRGTSTPLDDPISTRSISAAGRFHKASPGGTVVGASAMAGHRCLVDLGLGMIGQLNPLRRRSSRSNRVGRPMTDQKVLVGGLSVRGTERSRRIQETTDEVLPRDRFRFAARRSSGSSPSVSSARVGEACALVHRCNNSCSDRNVGPSGTGFPLTMPSLWALVCVLHVSLLPRTPRWITRESARITPRKSLGEVISNRGSGISVP